MKTYRNIKWNPKETFELNPKEILNETLKRYPRDTLSETLKKP